MSKYRRLAKITRLAKLIKLIARIFPIAIRLVSRVIGTLLGAVFRRISKRFRVSITFKAVSVYTLLFSAVLAVFTLALVTAFSAYYLNDLNTSLENNAKYAVQLIDANDTSARDRVKKYAETEGIRIAFLDNQNKLSFNSAGSEIISGYDRDYEDEFFFSDQYLNYKVKTGLNGSLEYVLVSHSLVPGIRDLLIFLGCVAVSVLLALLLTAFVGFRTLKKMLKPIDDMIATARLVSARDLHTRLNMVASHDELKELADTFNEMLERIQVSYELQNQFVSDASHELRTPIAVVQGYANMLERWGKDDKAVLDEAIAAISNEAQNMKELVEKLLFLARADKDTLKLEKSEFMLTELVDEVVRETRLIAKNHQVMGDTDEASHLTTIVADRGLIKQAMRIFVDNSVKHTPPGGTIRVGATVSRNRILLHVEDTGSGIPQEDLPYVFNRFYKCDKSRSRDAGGTGLGLSIAKWIVEKHQGTIRVESQVNQGTKIIVAIPMVQ